MLFAMGFDSNLKRNTNEEESRISYYLPHEIINDYNVLINGVGFYDQNINDSITRCTELLKLTTGKSEDCSTGCQIGYDYYLEDYNIVAVNLSH